MNRNFDMQRKIVMILTGCLLMSLIAAPVNAADKKDKAAREGQRRLAMLKQQMETEKAELQAGFEKEKAALQEKAEQAEKAGNAVRTSLSAEKKRYAALEQELEALRKEKIEIEALKQKTEAALGENKAALETTRKLLAESQKDLRLNDAQRKELSKSLALRDNSLAACTEKNVKLHAFGMELVKVYEKPSSYEAVLRTEGFSQLKRVELENLLQDYRDKLDEQRVGLVAR